MSRTVAVVKRLQNLKKVFLTAPTKTKILVASVIIILVGLAALSLATAKTSPLSLLTHPSEKVYTVTLSSQGFDPSTSTISQWDRVKFVTTAGKEFWPASDLHPTHEIYPTFDPKRPVSPSDSWTFQFDRVGEWHFHDHLDPYFKGVIKVVAPGQAAVSLDCSGPNKDECWSQAIEKAIRDQGVEAALNLATYIYSNDPKGPEACHSLTHEIGNDTFLLFHNHKDFKVTAKAAICNYGFYHGFMEKLVESGADLKEAGAFCKYIDSQLAPTAPQSGGQCYHGIGHGTVSAHDPSLWGNAEAMITPALQLCEQVAPPGDNLFRCVSGIYNGIGNFYVTGDYKLVVDKADPYKICRSQPASYQVSCYGNLHPTITWITGNDFQAEAKFAEAIPDDTLAKTALGYVVQSVAPSWVGKDNYSELISNCRTIQERLREACTDGYVTGLMILGRPDLEYVDAFNYCRSSAFSLAEKDACFGFVIPYLKTLYPNSKYQQVCGGVEDTYHKYCN